MKKLASIPLRMGYVKSKRFRDSKAFRRAEDFCYLNVVIDALGRIRFQLYSKLSQEVLKKYNLSVMLPKLELIAALKYVAQLGVLFPDLEIVGKDAFIKSTGKRLNIELLPIEEARIIVNDLMTTGKTLNYGLPRKVNLLLIQDVENEKKRQQKLKEIEEKKQRERDEKRIARMHEQREMLDRLEREKQEQEKGERKRWRYDL